MLTISIPSSFIYNIKMNYVGKDLNRVLTMV